MRLPYATLAVALSLAACSGETMIAKFTPHDADVRARRVLQWFAAGNVDSAMARLAPHLLTPEVRPELEKIAATYGKMPIDSVHVIGAQTNTFNGTRHVNLTYEMHSSVGWIEGNVATVDTADTWLIEGVSANRIARKLEEASAFTLSGKSGLHYFWLLCTVVAGLTSLGTALWIATRRAYQKRWRWVLASLVGVGSFSMEWSSGQTGINPAQFQFGSAGFMRAGAAAPWIISFAVPIGAILAIMHYRKAGRAPIAPVADDMPPSATEPLP